MKRYYITRFINGVVLNPKEFVLTMTGKARWFKTRENATRFILKNGYEEKDIGHGIYIEQD